MRIRRVPETSSRRAIDDGVASSAGVHARHPRAVESLLELQRTIGNRATRRLGDVPPTVEDRIRNARGGGQPLPAQLRAPMETAFAIDFGSVRAHTDRHADELSRSLEAWEFTTGEDIFFRHGAYDVGSRRGRALIAHELAHVVQQRAGLVP